MNLDSSLVSVATWDYLIGVTFTFFLCKSLVLDIVSGKRYVFL